MPARALFAHSDMTEHENPTVGHAGRSIRAVLASTLAAGLLLAACGADRSAADEDAVATTTSSSADAATTATSPPASSPVDTAVTTAGKAGKARRVEKAERAKPTPTTAATAPTPTTVALPVPIAPPADDEAAEPVVPLGTLAIPALDLERTFYDGIRLPTFDLGPGHWPGSAMPGQPGNVVIGGHRTNSNADFRYIDQLSAGDEMILTTNEGASFTYVVESTEITSPFASRVIYQTPRKTATLFACHPPGSVRQRVVVHLSMAP